LRIHRSFLINLMHVKRLEKGEGGFVVLTGEYKIPVASRKRDVMINLLNELAE
jgi:two-component system LytT family response regulator